MTVKQGSKQSLPTHIEMTRNILRLFDSATGEEMQQGLTWYDSARDYAAALAAGTDYSVEQCAGVIAALSPQCPWALNKEWARRLVEWHAAGDYTNLPPRVSTSKNREKALHILNAYNAPLDILGGVKVRAFYANIVGDESVVTVDLWAWYCATGVKLANNEHVSKAANAPIQAAFCEAAAARGVSPSAMQAVVWVVARGSHA